MASIFNLLENKEATALSIVNSKVTLLEHITEKKESESKKDVVLENYNKPSFDLWEENLGWHYYIHLSWNILCH